MSPLLMFLLAWAAVICGDRAIGTVSAEPKQRWFVLHAAVNFTIALLALPSVAATAADPLASMLADDAAVLRRLPIFLANGLHLHHVLSFRLTPAELFHHLVFLPTLAFPGMLFDWGHMSACFCFFVCGLPGGLTYAALALNRRPGAEPYGEKRLTANLNVWLRCPGLLATTTVGYVVLVSRPDTVQVPLLAVVLQLIFMPFNALYYAKQTVANATSHATRRGADERSDTAC